MEINQKVFAKLQTSYQTEATDGRKLLDKINYPADLRLLKKNQLEQVTKELRSEVINVVSETGGHFGAALGVVEQKVALHYVYDLSLIHI